MNTYRVVIVGLIGLLLVAGKNGALAQENAPEHQPHHAAVAEEAREAVAEQQPDTAETAGEEQANSHHHHHHSATLPPEEDKAYSEWNHHIAGVFVLLAGTLALLATIKGSRFSWARYGWPSLFFLLGVFLFVRLDPESWPWGPLTFWESVTDVQVLQHMLFILIVLGIGAIEWLRARGMLTHLAWAWVFPSLALSAAVMLFLHKHGEGQSAAKIYLHHSIMATAGIVSMIAKVFDDTRLFDSKLCGYVWTTLIMFVGVMLLIYTE